MEDMIKENTNWGVNAHDVKKESQSGFTLTITLKNIGVTMLYAKRATGLIFIGEKENIYEHRR